MARRSILSQLFRQSAGYVLFLSLKRIICSGEIRQVHAHFHVNNPSERMTAAELGGSAWYDIGVYCLNLADFIYDSYPTQISAVSDRLSETVDKDMVVSLKYEGGKLASLSTSISCSRPNTAIICGTKGYIEIEPPLFNCPTEFEMFKDGDSQPTKHTFDLSNYRAEDYVYPHGDGFKYEIEHVRHCMRELQVLESPVMTFAATERLARVTDELMRQMTNA